MFGGGTIRWLCRSLVVPFGLVTVPYGGGIVLWWYRLVVVAFGVGAVL